MEVQHLFFILEYEKKSGCYFIVGIVFYNGLQQAGRRSKNGTVRIGNLQVYYERAGKGDAILLLHAGLQDHTMWEEQVKSLSARYEVITPDLPFHGKTIGTDTGMLAQDIIKTLLDSLHLQKISIAGLRWAPR